MKKITLIVNGSREKAIRISREVKIFLEDQGCRVVDTEYEGNDLKAIIALGGDGTIIDAIRHATKKKVPILGVNAGTLGFLAVVEEEDALEKIGRFLGGKENEDYLLQERFTLRSDLYRGDKLIHSSNVVNDVVVKGIAKVARVKVFLDGWHWDEPRGDGVLISATTGSTAYNLSVGGPFISPRKSLILVTAINRQGNRVPTIGIHEEEEVELRIVEGDDIFLSNDGLKSIPLKVGDRVLVGKAQPYQLVMFDKHHFYKAIDEKLYLKGHI